MYTKWQEKTLTDFSDAAIEAAYNDGFLFTRLGQGVMHQTRSLRIDLAKFDLTSENRRVLRKTDGLSLTVAMLPYRQYTWDIGKLAKDFYDKKFGVGTFSANKMKELMTNDKASNFNRLLIYSFSKKTSSEMPLDDEPKSAVVGYCVARETNNLLHYCYPFYSLSSKVPNLGLGMMLQAVIYAKNNRKKYVYLGSATRPADVYKLQFSGLEWRDKEKWRAGMNDLEKILQYF